MVASAGVGAWGEGVLSEAGAALQHPYDPLMVMRIRMLNRMCRR